MQLFALIATLLLIIISFFVQKISPFWAGIIAVIPIKILAVSIFSYTHNGITALEKTTKGMILGQFFWGVVLLFLLIFIWYRKY